MAFGCPAGQLVPGGQLELAQYGRHVCFHGLDRDEQLLADLPVGVALRDQPQHLAFAVGQLVKLGIERRLHLGARCREGVQHEAGQPVREHRVAVGDPPDRVGKLGGGDRLGHVSPRAGPDHRDHVLGGVGRGQGQEAHVGEAGLDRLDDRVPAAAGHVHVQQHHVGDQRADQVDGRLHVVGLAHQLELPAELGPDTGPEQAVIVDQHDPGTHEHGMVNVTLVPSPTADVMTAVPPNRRIRPRMDSVTPLRSPGRTDGSNPLPRSLTTTLATSASTSANSEITVTPDHLAALTVASRAAATSASTCSVTEQSPTVTISTWTPYRASTSCCTSRNAEEKLSAALPPNSTSRSSRSCTRASATTCCGLAAWRWISASVCSTESCPREATSARSSSRTLAWRSSTRSRPIRSHQGPSSSTIAAITSATAPSGRSSAISFLSVASQLTPAISSTPASTILAIDSL